jgi:hypothetical protein
MNKFFIFVVFILIPFVSFSQLSETFSDGLFYGNDRDVEWTGDTGKFIVNKSSQLQLNALSSDSTAQLKTTLAFSKDMQCEWWMKMSFNPTKNNYAKVFLCSDEDNLTGELNGLFVRIGGNTNKTVCLIQSQKGKGDTTLIEGTEKRLTETSIALRLKAVWDNDGIFRLYSKLDSEDEYVLEDSCNILGSFEGAVFGLTCYFTATRKTAFYFDDFLVQKVESGNPDPDDNPNPNNNPNTGDSTNTGENNPLAGGNTNTPASPVAGLNLSEAFSDGSFYGNDRAVKWTGDTNKFIVNESFQLQLNASSVDDSPAQLKTAVAFSRNMQWEWWMKIDCNPSSGNYVRVFLCSDESDLTDKLNGLFIRIGYDDDNVCLIQSQNGKNNKTLIKGAEKRLNRASVALRLKAVWDNDGTFRLYSKLDGETEFVSEGSCNITETFENTVFGLACYFTATRKTAFYFDDFLVRELVDSDTVPNSPSPEDTTNIGNNPETPSSPDPGSSLSETFSDGSFYGSNRAVKWTGDANKFIVNESLQLQLNAPDDAESPVQLKTALAFSRNMQWEWWMKISCNPSSGNYVRVFLCSDESDLTDKLNGLFIRIGYDDDNVCLIQSQNGKNNKTLIKGAEKRLNRASVALRLKAVWDNDGTFSLYSKLDGEDEYVLEGSCNISETFESAVFGLACYFTPTRSTAFYFDDFRVHKLESGNPDPEPDPDTDSNPNPNTNPNTDLDQSTDPDDDSVTDKDSDTGDVIITEILYDPPAGCAEYVEIYNNSDKTFDLRFLSFTTRKSSDGSLNKSYPLAESEILFHPEEYLVITKSRDLVCLFFDCHSESIFAEISKMPALVNTSGCVVILDNRTGEVIDEFAYSPSMHTEGSANKKGIALERTDFNRPADDADNWRSASAESGFGTPGYPNSQKASRTGINKINIVYPLFSADNYNIHYQLDKPGYRCRAFVYDVAGRIVNTIANNELLSTEGALLWNGKGASGRSLTAGIYIIYMEAYNMDGDIKKFRKPVVVK